MSGREHPPLEDGVGAFAWCGRFTIHGEHDDCMGWGDARRPDASGDLEARDE